MTSSMTTRLTSANSSRAVKAPVRSVCTTNITASGLSAITTIDGSLTPAADDRFLLAGQTSSVDNGIYVASSGTWTRATDFDANRDVAKGTLIVTEGGLTYRLTSSNPITIGTTALTFASNDSSTIVASLASTATGAGASLVGIEDAGSLFTGTTAEAALQEVVTRANTQTITGGKTFSGALTSTGAADLSGASSLLLKTSVLNAGHSMINGTLTASVAASALTIAIKTLAGADPSATDPVYIMFRNATAATGDYAVITLTAATSLTVSSGSTLGATSSQAFRLWVVGFNDGGTFRLGVIKCSVVLTSFADIEIYPLGQFPLVSSTAEGGAGGADQSKVFYTSSAVTSKPYVVLGYMTWESGLATAGTWSAAPTRIQLFNVGTPLPGQILQRTNEPSSAVNTGTTTVPNDDTIPQNTEGTEFMTISITPNSAANILEVDALFNGAVSAGSPMAAGLFQDSTADALTATQSAATADVVTQLVLQHQGVAATTSATTFKLRAGPSTAGTITFNGAAAGRKFGGVMRSQMRVTELMT